MTIDQLVTAQVEAALERASERLAERVVELLVKKLPRSAANAAPVTKPGKPLSLPKAADYLGISETTLREHVREKRIEFTRPGGSRYRFALDVLDAFAAAGKAAPKKTGVDFAGIRRRNLNRALGGK